MEPHDIQRFERRSIGRRGLGFALCTAACGFFGAFVMPSQTGLHSPRLCEDTSLVTRHARGPKVNARRSISPYYSNEDRERLARLRQEKREHAREFSQNSTWVTEQMKLGNIPTVNLDKLPPLEDIYNRQFTGDADKDPIGGRKRYLYYIMFKSSAIKNAFDMKKIVAEYWYFLKKKMSCKDIQITPRKSPIDGNSVTILEYEMKEYGEIPRTQNGKNKYNKAYMVEFRFKAPVSATQYIQQKLYSDNNVLRFMALSLTRSFTHVGEDNELLL
ncbi:Hypothetical protein SCF082_LOCUS27899 [Durusdinium trenchii]|uniref:Ribosomal protein S6 n=2 Tax=Durusdinium trenchii TaxID=1381693 RepID=A0ABP0MIM4_9DINO